MLAKITSLLLCASCFTAIGCSKSNSRAAGIMVSILPQKYLVERITGSLYEVNVLVPPGQNPESYEPTLGQLKNISSSIIYFRIGYIPFELSQLDKIAAVNPAMQIVDISAGIELIRGGHEHTDEHDNHGGVDPHIWLSAKSAGIIAANMFSALKTAAPQHTEVFSKNYQKLAAEIMAADKKISESLDKLKGKTFLSFHPAWSYFARDYGLRQISVEFDSKEPSPSGIKRILSEAKKQNIRAIFIQKEFSAEIAHSIAKELNIKVVQLDPLGENLIETLYTICDTLKREME